MSDYGKFFIWIGLGIALVGIFLVFRDEAPLLKKIGNLPGDIRIEGENFRFYFPLTTSILFSLILSLILILVRKFRG